MTEKKEPKKSKLKSKRLFTAPKSMIINGRRVKVINIGALPEKIRIEVDVPDYTVKDKEKNRDYIKKMHDIFSTHEPGRMIVIWENDEDLKRNVRTPFLIPRGMLK